MSVILTVCLEFMKTGFFAVGGGFATLPFLFEMAKNYDWFTAKELTDMIAVSESTPGAIGINMATYAGSNAAGILGGIVSTLSLIFPPVVVVIIIARILEKFRGSKVVQGIMNALRPAALGLIAAAGYSLFITVFTRDSIGTGAFSDWFDWRGLIAFAIFVFLILKFKKHPVVYIAAGAAAGILFGL